MRLINADALKEKLNNFIIVGGRGYGKTECQRYLNKILSEIIDNEPTINPTIKEGRWIFTGRYDDDGRVIYQCSECKGEVNVFPEKIVGFYKHEPYCPYCGTRCGVEEA